MFILASCGALLFFRESSGWWLTWYRFLFGRFPLLPRVDFFTFKLAALFKFRFLAHLSLPCQVRYYVLRTLLCLVTQHCFFQLTYFSFPLLFHFFLLFHKPIYFLKFFFSVIRSVIRSAVRSAVRSVVRSVIRSRFCRRRAWMTPRANKSTRELNYFCTYSWGYGLNKTSNKLIILW